MFSNAANSAINSDVQKRRFALLLPAGYGRTLGLKVRKEVLRMLKHCLPAVVMMAAAGAALHAKADNNSLVGAWKVVKFEARATDGSVKNLYGEMPGGLIVYHESGHMSAQAMQFDLPKCGTTDRRMCPEKEARAAFEGYFGYWGRYEVAEAEGLVLHIVEGASLPDVIGAKLKRFYEISGDRLVLRTPPQQVRGVETVITVTAERIR